MREIRFGGLALSPDNVLMASGVDTRLPARLARLFRALADGRGQSVSKRDLLLSVWGTGGGSDQQLAKAISDLRRVLRRHGADQIESVYGSGYRLVPRDEASTRLMLRDKVQTLCSEAAYRVHERGHDSLRIAERLYTLALELDPCCRDAHLGLAEVQVHGIQMGFWPAAPAWQRARTHLDAARLVDPDCLTLYLLLSVGLGLIEDDPVAAAALQSDIRRCNRGLPVGHPVPSYLHLASGRADLAVNDIQFALDRDPASVAALAVMPYALMCAGRPADALHAVASSRNADSTKPGIQAMCGWVEATLAMPQDAVKRTSLARAAQPASASIAAIHAYALARNGEQAAALRLLQQSHDHENRRVPATSMAAIAWVALGRRDKAIESLKRAASERCFWRRIVYHDPRLGSIRDEPEVRVLFAAGPTAAGWAAS